AETVTSAADMWAASIFLAELFTGKRFWGDLPVETILLRVATGLPPKSEALNALPDSLRRAIARGLDLDPKKRPSAGALKSTILAAVSEKPSAGATRALMAALYAGEEQEEERARTALIQEPTTVRANAL